MNKYLQILKTYWQEALFYRSILIFWLIVNLLPLIVYFYLWKAIFAQKAVVAGYTFGAMISYYLGVSIAAKLIQSHIADEISREIREGFISVYLLKPVSHFFSKYIGELAFKVLEAAIALIPYLLVIYLLKDYFVAPELKNIFWLILIVPLSYTLYFMFVYILGLFSFWLTETWGITSIFQLVFLNIAAGQLVPLDFFGKTINQILSFLPFKYLLYFPVNLYLGRITDIEILKGIGIEIFWIVIVAFLVRLIYQKGLKRYEAVGG